MSEKSNASGGSPLDITEVAILRILDNHKGKENIISAAKMVVLIDFEAGPAA